MSVSMRAWMVPGAALAFAVTVALSPAVTTPAMAADPPAVPSVHIDDVQLAGIGQDIYYAITPAVQYVVGGGSYLVNFIPLIGGPIAAQININYFQGIQPVVEATVNALAGVVQDPFNIIATLSIYGSALYDIGYNWVSAQLQWLGLAPLPVLPSVASVRGASAPSAAARMPGRARAAAVETPPPTGEPPAPDPVVPVIMCCTPQPEPPPAVEGPVDVPTRSVARAPQRAAAVQGTPAEVRSAARAARGQASRAAVQARAAARSAAEVANG